MLLTAPALVSTREYATLGELWRMVTRSAFTELRYSYLRLVGCLLAMLTTFAVPIAGMAAAIWTVSAGTAGVAAAAIGIASTVAYGVMSLTYAPTIRHFRLPQIFALTLPLAALLYLAMTIDSARRYAFGVRSAWKGRSYGSRTE